MHNTFMTKYLAVDHGDKRIGVALSDSDGQISRPWGVIQHQSRKVDAAVVVDLAVQEGAEVIIVGQSLDEEGVPTPQGRKAARFADELSNQSSLRVVLWDESGSTQQARQAKIDMGVRRANRRGHMDDFAAAVILQSYLDTLTHTEDMV